MSETNDICWNEYHPPQLLWKIMFSRQLLRILFAPEEPFVTLVPDLTKWLNVPISNLLWETLIWKDTVHVWLETKSVCCLHQALNDLVASIKWWKTEFRSIVVALTLGRILKDYSTTFLTLKKDTFTVISCKTRTIPGFNSVTSAFYTYFSIFYANVSLLLLCTILFLSTTVFIYFKTET